MWAKTGDAHAKNYSLLIGAGPRIRLAPLYDLASILPYDQFDLHKVKLAMKVGGEYQLKDIGVRQWQKFAKVVRLDGDHLIESLRAMTARLLDEINEVVENALKDSLDPNVVSRLSDRPTKWLRECARTIGLPTER